MIFITAIGQFPVKIAGSEMNSDINPNADIGQKMLLNTYQKLLEVNLRNQ